MNNFDLTAWKLFAQIEPSRKAGVEVIEQLRQVAEHIDVGMPSIMRQYETWPTRTLYYRRHLVETQLLASAPGRHRRLAWLVFLSGALEDMHRHLMLTLALILVFTLTCINIDIDH